MSPDGKTLVSLGRDKLLLEWDLATGMPNTPMVLPPNKKKWNDHFGQLSPNGRVLALTSGPDRTVTLLDTHTRKPLREPLRLDAEPCFLRFSTDGNILAIGGRQGDFYLWRWQDGGKPRKIETPEKDVIVLYPFTPSGKQVVTGSMNPQNLLIHLWDVATGAEVFSQRRHRR